MNEPGLMTISMNELQRVKIIEAVLEGRLSGVRAADLRSDGIRGGQRVKQRSDSNRSAA
ncbi:hypothetical protein [Burkholderia vietnamiensis]|uniref:hypothetical protein n=1 Tax=Burkholderia vietnamiensis TaxID=60552 RepID=UPI000A8DCB74|nr:hypothetical protein [Burkholderia vietnamiensis]